MARPLYLSNSYLSVCVDEDGFVRDIYYPHVGLENHVGGYKHRIGVQVDGYFSWLDQPEWNVKVTYQPRTLVGETTYTHQGLGLSLTFEDIVYNELPIFVRHVTIRNPEKRHQQVRLFFGQEFTISESKFRNTGFYDPTKNAVIHYKGHRVFLINGRTETGGIDDYTVGMFAYQSREGSWRDAEDGELSKNAVEHGPVDSVVRFCVTCAEKEVTTMDYWLCAAESIDDVYRLNEIVLRKSPLAFVHSTRSYWSAWSHSREQDFRDLSAEAIELYFTSLLVLRAHIDHDGGAIASPDSDMLFYGKDSYAYVWPRDAAYLNIALDRAGYSEVTTPFFRFCKEILHADGYLHHKFQPDKSLGSTWHSSITQQDWLKDKILQLPIQEDETATVLYALWVHYQQSHDIEFIEQMYKPLIEKMANFLVAFRDKETGLPIHSYDLWEEVTGVSTYTCATIFGALNAAANFSELLGKDNHALTYRAVANDIRRVMKQHLFDPELNSFVRVAYLEENGVRRLPVVDTSSLYGLWYYDVLDPTDSQFLGTQQAVEDRLRVKQGIGGFIRYEGDSYFKNSGQQLPNPWIITTLWDLQRKLKYAATLEELREHMKGIQWTIDRLGQFPLLAEQYDPYSGEPRSVMPLAWSHGTYIETIQMYLHRYRELSDGQLAEKVADHE
jgi:GH15 family glucan-1,4-alpha-glucosidase